MTVVTRDSSLHVLLSFLMQKNHYTIHQILVYISSSYFILLFFYIQNVLLNSTSRKIKDPTEEYILTQPKSASKKINFLVIKYGQNHDHWKKLNFTTQTLKYFCYSPTSARYTDLFPALKYVPAIISNLAKGKLINLVETHRCTKLRVGCCT